MTVYVDGHKALRFRRVRGPGGTRDVRLVFRREGIPDDVVERTRADILQRWAFREED